MRVERLGTVDSTNRVALSRAVGTAVVAREQTGGRGRLDHAWMSPPGGLYLTCVMPSVDPPTTYQFWAAVAVAGALAGLGIDPEVRWPNDVLVRGRKIAGVLSENRGDRVIVGIGVNVNNPMERYPFGATSVVEVTGEEADLDWLLDAVLDLMGQMPSPAEVMARWSALSSTAGRRVAVRTLRGTVEGMVAGIDTDGALLVDTGRGVERVVEGDCRYLD